MSSFKDAAKWLMNRTMANIGSDIQGVSRPYPYIMVPYNVHWVILECHTEHKHYDMTISKGQLVEVKKQEPGEDPAFFGYPFSMQYFTQIGEVTKQEKRMVYDDEVIK